MRSVKHLCTSHECVQATDLTTTMSFSTRTAEDTAMAAGNTICFAHCRRMGIEEDFILQWREGVQLHGHEDAPRYDMPDYPSVMEHPAEAAAELDRLTVAGDLLVPSTTGTSRFMYRAHYTHYEEFTCTVSARLDEGWAQCPFSCPCHEVQHHGRLSQFLASGVLYGWIRHTRLFLPLGHPP